MILGSMDIALSGIMPTYLALRSNITLLLAVQAKERQGTRTDLNIVENLPQGSDGKTRDALALP